MGAALNKLLTEHDRAALPYDTIRAQVSHGANALVRLGFGIDVSDPDFAALRAGFLSHYAKGICCDTGLFDGMALVLGELEKRNLPWGIVTNKPGYLTNPLLEQLGLQSRASCVVSGDTLTKKKPDPEPLRYASDLIGTEPTRCVYIGDAERDIVAGKNAGMTTLVATFGYLSAQDRPETWGADGMIGYPEQILDWI